MQVPLGKVLSVWALYNPIVMDKVNTWIKTHKRKQRGLGARLVLSQDCIIQLYSCSYVVMASKSRYKQWGVVSIAFRCISLCFVYVFTLQLCLLYCIFINFNRI